MTWRGRLLVLGGIIVVGVGAVLVAPLVGRRMAFFQVGRVEFTGLHYLREDEIAVALGLGEPRSIFDPLDSLRARASRIPGVAAISIEPRLPGTLRVTVLEDLPVALAPFENHLVPVDMHGKQLPFDPSRQTTSLPIADSGAAPAALLAQVLLSDPDLYGEIELVRTDGSDLLLIIGGHRIRLRPEADAVTLQGVVAVREYLSEQGIAWQEIDARYHGRVFVRKGAA